MELTAAEIAVLRSDKQGGFTEETIGLLLHDKAPQEIVYSANKILQEHRRQVRRQTRAEKKEQSLPATRGEISRLVMSINESFGSVAKSGFAIIDVLKAKDIVSDIELDAFASGEICINCTSVRPAAGGYCPEVLTREKGKVITTKDIWPSLPFSLIDRVLKCTHYKKKGTA